MPSVVGLFAVILWGLSAIWIRILTQALGNLRAIVAFHSVAAILTLTVWLCLGKGAVMRKAIFSRWFYVRLFRSMKTP